MPDGPATKFPERPRAAADPAHAAAMTTATVTAAATELDLSTSVADPAAWARPPRLRLLRYEPDGPPPPQPPTAPVRRPQVVPADPVDPADLRRCIERVVRLALEVLDGRRPLAQLAPYLTPSAVRYVRAAVAQRPPVREPARMTSLHVRRPGAGVAEVAAVYRRGPRARALAARFERGLPGAGPARVPHASTARSDPRTADRPQWRCVVLRLL
jgi:hypothetical protein